MASHNFPCQFASGTLFACGTEHDYCSRRALSPGTISGSGGRLTFVLDRNMNSVAIGHL